MCQSKQRKKEEEGDDPMQVKRDTNEDSESSNSVASASLSESESEEVSPSTHGPLFQLSELMNQLPIRRGLSKHYKGKSQSFTSLAHVRNLEDLAKKASPHVISSYQRMKSCKSYAGLDGHNKYGPKATITKKSSRASFLSSLAARGNFVG